MKNKLNVQHCEYQSSSLDFSTQSCCSEDYHIQIYLENAISKNLLLKKNDISCFFIDKYPKVRLLAVNLYLKTYGYDESLKFTANDPFYRIRLHSIPNTDFSKLIEMVEDENVNVKLAVLEEIVTRDVPLTDKTHLFNYVGKCIVHPNLNVRRITAKLLHIFQGLELCLLDQLLSKNDDEIEFKNICGLIIYGLEDEYAEVRKNTIDSLYILSDEENVHKTFSYFVDTLNDESLIVRRAAISYIEKLFTKYKIIIDLETIKQICFLIKEENTDITKIIILALCNVKFENIEVLLEIIENIHSKLYCEDILSILISIFKNNTEVIINNVDQFYKYFPFLEQQVALTDKKYYCKLLIMSLCVFNRIPIKLNKNTKKHVDYMIQEILTSKKIHQRNLKDFTKDCLVKYIESSGKLRNIDKSLRKQKKSPDFMKFASKMIHYLNKYKDNKSNIKKINYQFTNINITDAILNNNTVIACFIYDLDFDIVRKINNIIKLVKIANLETGHSISLEFQVTTPFQNSFLIIENNKKKQLSYAVTEHLKVYFYDDTSSYFKYYLAIKDSDHEFVISKIKIIKRST